MSMSYVVIVNGEDFATYLSAVDAINNAVSIKRSDPTGSVVIDIRTADEDW